MPRADVQAPPPRSLVARVVGAARLDPATYADVARDRGATAQAALVVLLGAAAAGVGALGDGVGVTDFAVLLVVGLLLWATYALAAYAAGTRVLGAAAPPAGVGGVLRALAFADAPAALAVFGAVPVVGGLLGWVGIVWSFVAGVVALRQVLGLGTGRAVAAALLALPLLVAVLVIVVVVLGAAEGWLG